MAVRNSDDKSKVELRNQVINERMAGKVFVPFCGYGLLMCWPEEEVEACDTDKDCIEHWAENWPKARADLVAAQDYEFEPGIHFAVGDFDAFGSPWKAVGNFLDRAPLTTRVEILLTDGSIQKMQRTGTPCDFAGDLAFREKDRDLARAQVKEWPGHAADWMRKWGRVEVREVKKNHQKMVYYGWATIWPERTEFVDESVAWPEYVDGKLDPPAPLSDEEAKLWRWIVKHYPDGRFVGNEVLLERYCRIAVQVRAEENRRNANWRWILSATSTLASLATKLRMTPQYRQKGPGRTRPENAEVETRHHRDRNTGPDPTSSDPEKWVQ